MSESVRVFRKCVGDTNPLTFGAVGALGKVKLAQGTHAEGLVMLTEALEGEASKDAFQVDETFMLLNNVKTILLECVIIFVVAMQWSSSTRLAALLRVVTVARFAADA